MSLRERGFADLYWIEMFQSSV